MPLLQDPTAPPWARRPRARRGYVAALVLAAVGLVLALSVTPTYASSPPVSAVWIVAVPGGVGGSLTSELVGGVGGVVVRDLGVANAVEATLTATEVASLSAIPGVQLTPDVAVSVQSSTTPSTAGTATRAPAAVFPEQTGATKVWASGDTGQGVNVAVLDTGIDRLGDFGTRLVGGVDLTGSGNPFADGYGHGTFVAGLIASSGSSSDGEYQGEAPGAGLVSVKVAGASGTTDLATVIEGVGWTIANAAALHIRVLNMSLGFVPFESTALNPLDQAVQAAWDAGIVVVASAGNAGPFDGTILSPGDDPTILTVGALDDLGQDNPAADQMTSFSSVGPTSPDGWMKPDLVTSGRSVVSLAAPGSTIDEANPSARIGTSNFVGSGTSFSAAITSGAAALVLEAHPLDTPDQVKAALLATATPGPVGNPFVDGHGDLDVAAAVASSASLLQPDGDLAASTTLASPLAVAPGASLEAGYQLSMTGTHAASALLLVGAQATLDLACTPTGATAGTAVLALTGGPYPVVANDTSAHPSAALAVWQGSASAPAACKGSEYVTSASLDGALSAVGGTGPVSVRFRVGDAATLASSPLSAAVTVAPLSAASLAASIPLGSVWSTSSWDPSNWSGLSVNATTPADPTSGSAWNGSAWNGSAWNGSAWNGSAWNGSAWNGSAWNGSAWNGSAWNGSAWNGSAWNGSAWNGSAWNGSAWNGSAWN